MVLATLEPINTSNDTHVHPSIEIEKPSVVLGRDPEKCDVVVTTSKSISMEHCQFDFRNDKWYITDLKSMNGTMVGEDRVTDGATMEIFDNNVLKFGRDTVSYRFKTREKKEKKSLKDVIAEGKKKVHDESVISFPTATGTKVVPVSPDGFIRPEASLQSISNFIPVEDEEDEEEELEDDERQISPSFEEFRELSGRVVDLENVVSNTRKRGISPDIKRTRREEKHKTPITPIDEQQFPLSPSRDEFKLLRERVAYLESNAKNLRASSPNPDQLKLLRERVTFLENAVNQAQQSPPSPMPKRDEPSQILIDSIYDLASKLHKQMGLEQPMDDSHEITPNDQLFITKNLLQQMLLSSRKKQPPPDMQQLHDMGVERYAHDLERQLVSAQVDVNQEPLPPLPPELDEILRDELEIKEEQIEQLTQQIMDMNTSRYSNSKNRMSSSLLHQLQEAENARRLVYEYERRQRDYACLECVT
jgi:pSer/pThr/pTyr-binding forkhead associated (FHA) protein